MISSVIISSHFIPTQRLQTPWKSLYNRLFKELVILWWGFWWECYFEIDWFPLKCTKLEDGKETLIIPTISLVIASSAPSHRCE